MYTLQERRKFNDVLWDCLISETDPDRMMEYIKALELNYRHIELLRERAKLLAQRQRIMQNARERELRRREQLFERNQMNRDTQLGLIIAFIILAVIGILWACAGCQTLGGACRDIESAARYGRQHLLVDD